MPQQEGGAGRLHDGSTEEGSQSDGGGEDTDVQPGDAFDPVRRGAGHPDLAGHRQTAVGQAPQDDSDAGRATDAAEQREQRDRRADAEGERQDRGPGTARRRGTGGEIAGQPEGAVDEQERRDGTGWQTGAFLKDKPDDV